MSITSLNIAQDNKVGDSNLLPIHSPLVFLVEATYVGSPPEDVRVEVIVDGDVLNEYRLVPVVDLLSNLRQFAFVADTVIKGIMSNFDDVLQLNNTLSFVSNITKFVTLRFYDPLNKGIEDEVDIDFAHAAKQFSEYPNLVDEYNNENRLVYGVEGGFVYCYFYNDNPLNIITVDSPDSIVEDMADYDDTIFTDSDDVIFEAAFTP